MARLSAEVSSASFQCWSGHSFEVVEVRCSAATWARVEESAVQYLKPRRTFATAEGGIIVWEPHVNPEVSISRTLEAHQVLWLQPMLVVGGWEQYDGIALNPKGEQGALDALSAHWPTQVVRRRAVGAEDLLASMFLSLRPALEGPTLKQAEALVAAGHRGYYRSPRLSTTAEVAQGLGIGRSAFEERLRGGENRLLGAIVPALEQYRFHGQGGTQPPKGTGTSRRRGLPAKR